MENSSYVAVKSVGAATVVRVTREKVSEHEARIIQTEALAAAQAGKWKLVMDMSEVRFLTSAGLGALVTLEKNCRSGGGKMAVFGLAPDILGLLKVTRLDKVFRIMPDQAEAVLAVT